MKSIFVSGGGGFIGKNLIPALKKKNYNIFAPSSKDCDLRDLRSLKQYFSNNNPEYVIHLASHAGGISYIKSNSANIFYDNLLINTQLLEACRLFQIEKVIILNSINIYPISAKVPYKESDLFLGDPEETILAYGLSKKMVIYQSKFYFEQFGLNSLNVICDNVYGNHDIFNEQKSRVIPANILRFEKATREGISEVNCWGSGTPLRSFIHISDVVNGILQLLEKDFHLDYVNLGREVIISIRELVEMIARFVFYKGTITWNLTKPDGHAKRYLNCDKVKTVYGIKASKSLEDGIKQTIDWYRNKQ